MPMIRIHDDVAARLRELARPNESPNAVIRRVMGLEPNQARSSRTLYQPHNGDVYGGRIETGHAGWLLQIDDVTDTEVQASVLECPPSRRRSSLHRRFTYSRESFDHAYQLVAALTPDQERRP